MAHQPSAIHRFDRFELRPAQRELLVDGQPAALGARAFDLLLALVEHRDRVVSKNELLDLVWPGLVVEENNLQVQVSTLRKVLGPKAIATVPGRGYRFTSGGEELSAPAHVPAPPRSPTAPRALPQRPQTVLGRDGDLNALLALLDAHPLVTVVGPGGIGKTTLAHCAAHARASTWADGCVWVELAALTDARLVASTLAQALDLQLGAGDALPALVAALKPMQLLMVIDNAEHLADALAPVITAVLRESPGVHLLVTSQSPLKVQGEQQLRLEALSVPPERCTLAEATQHGAVALFAERAREADRRFALTDDNLPDVVEICRRLDGLPLALELAAARVPLLGVRGVAERLDDRFKLLAGSSRSAPTRQQTLQAALDWSLTLLPATERRLFAQLGVFAGGFTLTLAREVLTDDTLDEWTLIDALATLVDHSLLNVSGGEVPRYGLSETARAYALSASGETSLPRARHATAMRTFFDAAPADWLQMSDADWLARYEPELDNLRAALGFAHGQGDALTVVSLVGAASPLWHHLSLYDEARRWHEQSEAFVIEPTPPVLAARWWRAAQWAWNATDAERARAAASRALTLYRELGDVHGLYAELTGLAGMWREPNATAEAALAEAITLERPEWPARERAWGQRARADVALAHSQITESRAAREAELTLRTQAGDSRGRLRALSLLAELAHTEGRLDESIALWQSLVEELRGRRTAAALVAALRGLARALAAADRVQEAQRLQAEATALAPTAP